MDRKYINGAREIFNNLIELETEEARIHEEIKKIKLKYGISKHRIYDFTEFSSAVKKITGNADKSETEALFTEMLSDPKNVLFARSYLVNTFHNEFHLFRVAAFYNLIEFPDIISEIIGRFSIREMKLIVDRYQDYWINKYNNSPTYLLTLFINCIENLKEEHLMNLITNLGNKNMIQELRRIKMSGEVKGKCLEKLDSYLVLETLKNGSL